MHMSFQMSIHTCPYTCLHTHAIRMFTHRSIYIFVVDAPWTLDHHSRAIARAIRPVIPATYSHVLYSYAIRPVLPATYTQHTCNVRTAYPLAPYMSVHVNELLVCVRARGHMLHVWYMYVECMQHACCIPVRRSPHAWHRHHRDSSVEADATCHVMHARARASARMRAPLRNC